MVYHYLYPGTEKLKETEVAIADGADDIDIVVDYCAFKVRILIITEYQQ